MLIALCCTVFFFYGLSSFGLVGADEPRYAQIAREMLARHDVVTPTLWGQPWLEKPVLYYWEAMLSYRIFGVRDWAARVPAAVDATLMVLVAYWFARRFFANRARAAVMMLASSAAVIGFAHAGSTDMPLTATFTIGMLMWLVWLKEQKKLWLAAFYLMMALGALAKGPVAPGMAALVLVTYALARREWRVLWRTLWLPGVGLFLAVALPWYIAVQLANPQFFREFFINQNLARYTTDLYRHRQPFWYYVPVLLLSLLPWAALATAGCANSLRNLRQRTADADLGTFLLIWAVLPVVFFSLSESKLPGYILPAVPAWALLAALYGTGGSRDDTRSIATHKAPLTAGTIGMALLHAALVSTIAAAAILAAPIMARQPLAGPLETGILVATAVFAVALLIWLRAGAAAAQLATVAILAVSMVFVIRHVGPVIDARSSARQLATAIADGAAIPVVVDRDVRREIEYGLGFYLNRPVLSYPRNEQPASEHLLVTGHELQSSAAELKGRSGMLVAHAGQSYLYRVQ